MMNGFQTARAVLATTLLIVSASLAGAQTTPSASVVLQIGHSDQVTSSAFSPDGRIIATASQDSRVKLWETETGRLIRTFEGHTESVEGIAFSPDGRLIASASGDNTARLWEAASGKELFLLKGHSYALTSIAFSPDGRSVLTGSGDNTMKLWDVSSGRMLRSFNCGAYVNAVAVSPDGRTAVSANERTLILWDIGSGRELRVLKGHRDQVLSVAFAPDGTRIVSAGGDADRTLKLWDVATGNEIRTFKGQDGAVDSVRFSPDGSQIASGGLGDPLILWDAATGRLIRKIALDNSRGLAFAPDGRTITSGSKLFDIHSGSELRELKGLGGPVTSLARTSDARFLVSGSSDKSVSLWNADTGNRLRGFTGHQDQVNAVAISPDTQLIASASADKTVKLWETLTGREQFTLRGHTEIVQATSFSPDGRVLASGGGDGSLRLWDTSTGRLVRAMDRKGTYAAVNALSFSSNGANLLVGGSDRLSLFEVASGREVRVLRQGEFQDAVAYSPDGRLVAAASADHMLTLWDANSGRELRTLKGHDAEVLALAFSPDGRSIVSGGRDKAVKVWDVASGRELRTIRGHSWDVTAVTFSHGGKVIVSGSTDGSLRHWSFEGELLATSVASADGEWVTITPEGFFDSSANGAKLLNAVHGLEVSSIDQLYDTMHRPDLVRERLIGDPRGLVKEAATRLDLTKAIGSGSPPHIVVAVPEVAADKSAAQITLEAVVTDTGGGIGKAEWRVNGVTQSADTRGFSRVDSGARPSSDDRSARVVLRQTLPLRLGENVIDLRVYNAAGLVASEPVIVRTKRDGQGDKPRLFVLAAGIDVYDDGALRLSFSGADAKALGDAFRQAGGRLYRTVEVTTLLDGDVTVAGLDATFSRLSREITADDVFVMYVAGHGKTVDGRYYFLPRDFRYEGEGSVARAGIGQNQWQRWLSSISAQKSILFYDTCDSGSLTQEKMASRGLEEKTALDFLTRATGRTTLTAATADAPALEGYRGHGLFTYAILDAFAQATPDANGFVDLDGLIAYVDQAVPDISERVFHIGQFPQVARNGGNFPVVSPTKVLADTPELQIPRKPTHVVVTSTAVYPTPGQNGESIQTLTPGTSVVLVKRENDWVLVGREGKLLGYLAGVAVAPLQ